MKVTRHRPIYAILIITVIIAGLSSRRFARYLPSVIAAYAGDTLYALMIYLGIGLIFTKYSIKRVAIIALLCSLLIELSQLYHAGWIDAVRHTRLGGLILGFGFLWSDLICYSIGVGLGFIFESVYLTKQKS